MADIAYSLCQPVQIMAALLAEAVSTAVINENAPKGASLFLIKSEK